MYVFYILSINVVLFIKRKTIPFFHETIRLINVITQYNTLPEVGNNCPAINEPPWSLYSDQIKIYCVLLFFCTLSPRSADFRAF